MSGVEGKPRYIYLMRNFHFDNFSINFSLIRGGRKTKMKMARSSEMWDKFIRRRGIQRVLLAALRKTYYSQKEVHNTVSRAAAAAAAAAPLFRCTFLYIAKFSINADNTPYCY